MGRLLIPLLFATSSWLLAGCEPDAPSITWLADQQKAQKVDARRAADRLVALPIGLNALEPMTQQVREILIGVHGFGTRGVEWVYPLTTLDDASTQTYFYRWDYRGCPTGPAATLSREIEGLMASKQRIERIRVVGHSYGGVLIALLARDWNAPRPIEIHAVAAPLAGMRPLEDNCGYAAPTRIANQVAFFEWRTVHELDGAFKDLQIDPQVVELPDSKVTRLPSTYRGNRLGHNRSLSWVAEVLAGTTPEH